MRGWEWGEGWGPMCKATECRHCEQHRLGTGHGPACESTASLPASSDGPSGMQALPGPVGPRRSARRTSTSRNLAGRGRMAAPRSAKKVGGAFKLNAREGE